MVPIDTTHLLMALSKGFLRMATIILIFCGLASSLAVTPALSLESSHLSGNFSTLPFRERCTNSTQWVGRGYKPEDCASAIRLLFTRNQQHLVQDYDFLAHGEIPSSSHPVARTPKRYIQGTCTIAIIMLEFFTESGVKLPDQPETLPTRRSDITSWLAIWRAATRIWTRCGEDSVMGWQAGGHEEAIGLFMWTTGSGMDKSIP